MTDTERGMNEKKESEEEHKSSRVTDSALADLEDEVELNEI